MGITAYRQKRAQIKKLQLAGMLELFVIFDCGGHSARRATWCHSKKDIPCEFSFSVNALEMYWKIWYYYYNIAPQLNIGKFDMKVYFYFCKIHSLLFAFISKNCAAAMGDVLSGEFTLSQKCKHRIWQVKRKYGLSPNPYYKQKEQTRKTKILYVCSFFLLVIF